MTNRHPIDVLTTDYRSLENLSITITNKQVTVFNHNNEVMSTIYDHLLSAGADGKCMRHVEYSDVRKIARIEQCQNSGAAENDNIQLN
jgi:lipoate synthase